jgi:hypothetical protein
MDDVVVHCHARLKARSTPKGWAARFRGHQTHLSLILQRSGTSQTCCWTNVGIPYGEHVEKLDVSAAVKKYWAQVVIACRVTHRFDRYLRLDERPRKSPPNYGLALARESPNRAAGFSNSSCATSVGSRSAFDA